MAVVLKFARFKTETFTCSPAGRGNRICAQTDPDVNLSFALKHIKHTFLNDILLLSLKIFLLWTEEVWKRIWCSLHTKSFLEEVAAISVNEGMKLKYFMQHSPYTLYLLGDVGKTHRTSLSSWWWEVTCEESWPALPKKNNSRFWFDWSQLVIQTVRRRWCTHLFLGISNNFLWSCFQFSVC